MADNKKRLYDHNNLIKGIVIGVVIGVIFSLIILKTSSSIVEREVKTSCDIDIKTLYEKSCEVHEDCYGRLELCSSSLNKCVTTVQIDKTNLDNIRIPDSREECETNGGTWKIEVVETTR